MSDKPKKRTVKSIRIRDGLMVAEFQSVAKAIKEIEAYLRAVSGPVEVRLIPRRRGR